MASFGDTVPLQIIGPCVIGGIVFLSIAISIARAKCRGYEVCSCSFQEHELWNISQSDWTLGSTVRRVDDRKYKVTGHKFLYKIKLPNDPYFFKGLITVEQFQAILTIINKAIINDTIGDPKCRCGSRETEEERRDKRYDAATYGCKQATMYLLQNNIRGVVYQVIERQTDVYVNNQYNRTKWDTAIFISFMPEDLRLLDELLQAASPNLNSSIPTANSSQPRNPAILTALVVDNPDYNGQEKSSSLPQGISSPSSRSTHPW
jgi:hypothetical protein